MNAVERLQAAIERLEELKAASTPGPWELDQHYNFDNDSIVYGADAPGVFAAFSEAIEEDAELIVTLHRTIDAQLAILRDTVKLGELIGLGEEGSRWRSVEDALALADSILGGV